MARDELTRRERQIAAVQAVAEALVIKETYHVRVFRKPGGVYLMRTDKQKTSE